MIIIIRIYKGIIRYNLSKSDNSIDNRNTIYTILNCPEFNNYDMHN